MDPVAAHLETRESGGSWAESLRIDDNCLVNSIHPSWSWNMFMAGAHPKSRWVGRWVGGWEMSVRTKR